MSITQLKKRLALRYEIKTTVRDDDDIVISLFNKRNSDFVACFTICGDIIYNFKYIGSFEELKHLVALLEEYQDA